jgi:hypothetical protein
MKSLVQNVALTAALIVPCAIVLVALEIAQVVPGKATRRVVIVRGVLLGLSVVLLALLGVLIIARFIELRVK